MAVYYHEGRFPPDDRIDWLRLVPLLGPAVAALARYDGALSAVPNPRVLLSPMTTQEAVLSSRHDVLRVVRAGNGRRGNLLVFPALLNIAEGRTVF